MLAYAATLPGTGALMSRGVGRSTLKVVAHGFALKAMSTLASPRLVSERSLLGLHTGRSTRATFTTEASKPRRAQERRTTTILVSPLAPDVDDQRLKVMFLGCGEIRRLGVRRDLKTGDSLGYGWVTFNSLDAVDKALELDGTNITGSPSHIRVLVDHLNVVFVRGLPWDVDDDQVKAIFEQCGEVVDVKTRTARYGHKVQVFRFVTFASAESGAKAVKLDGMKIHQQTLHIQYSRPRPRGLVYHPTVGEVPVSTTVQITGLPPQVDDDWLYNIFSPCGEILYARTQRQRGVGGSLGFGNSLSFGHVAFTSAAAADKALKFVGLEIAGQCIRVERTESHLDARSRLQMAEANRSVPERIHINGLPRNFDNARLQREFEQFGEVLSAEVIRDRKSGQSRGFGFVQFASSDSVDEAIKREVVKVDGFSLGIRRAVRYQSLTARPLTINNNPVS